MSFKLPQFLFFMVLGLALSGCDGGSSGKHSRRNRNAVPPLTGVNRDSHAPYHGERLQDDGELRDDAYYAHLRPYRGDIDSHDRVRGDREGRGGRGDRRDRRVHRRMVRVVIEGREVMVEEGDTRAETVYNFPPIRPEHRGDVYNFPPIRPENGSINPDVTRRDFPQGGSGLYADAPDNLVEEAARDIVIRAGQQGRQVEINQLITSTGGLITANTATTRDALELLPPTANIQELSSGLVEGPEAIPSINANGPGTSDPVDLYQDTTFRDETNTTNGMLADMNQLVTIATRDQNQGRAAIMQTFLAQTERAPLAAEDASRRLLGDIQDVFLLVNRPANYRSIGLSPSASIDRTGGRVVVKLNYTPAGGTLQATYLVANDLSFRMNQTSRGTGPSALNFTRWTADKTELKLFDSPYGGRPVDEANVRFDLKVECFPEPGVGTGIVRPELDCTKAVIRLYQQRKYRNEWLPCKIASIIYRQQDYRMVFDETDYLALRGTGLIANATPNKGNTNLSQALYNTMDITLARNYESHFNETLPIRYYSPNVRYLKVHSFAVPYGTSKVRVMFQVRTQMDPVQPDTAMPVVVLSGPLQSYNQVPDLSNHGQRMQASTLNWNNPLEEIGSGNLLTQGFQSVVLKYNDPSRGNLVVDFVKDAGQKQRVYLYPWVLPTP